MDYFKTVNIPSWKLIQDFCKGTWDGKFTKSRVFVRDDLRHIASLVTKDILDVYGVRVQVKTAIMFINEAHFVQDLHIDGFEIDRKGASNIALNIPIQNCDESPMHWFSGNYTLSKSHTDDLQYLKINWHEPPVMVMTKIIDTPTLVQINVPHYVENKSNDSRLMLSIRFADDTPLANIQ